MTPSPPLSPDQPSRLRGLLLCTLLLALLPASLDAQPIRYEYDALGRLTVVSTPEGVALYEYDAVGNILRITTHRYDEAAGPVAILGMSPDRGAPGTVVTLYGRGFGLTPAENQLAFNDVAAPVIAATASILTTVVPPGATTGPLTLTTPQGTATSPGPFTVLQAFALSPDQADVALGGSIGFQARLGGTPTAEVTWRVNGIVGGNAALGTISPGGTYTAPGLPPTIQPVSIEAVRTADPTQVAWAGVRVVGQTSGLEAAAPVSVAVTAPTGPVASATVSVRLGLPSSPVASAPVAVTAGPAIRALAPLGGPPGAVDLPLTLAGANLQGASAIRFLRDGSVDPTLTVTNVIPTGDGTSVSGTLSIGASAAPGARVVHVVTPQGTSSAFDLGPNRFTVTAP